LEIAQESTGFEHQNVRLYMAKMWQFPDSYFKDKDHGIGKQFEVSNLL
jgi:hypothetical protein